MKIAHLILVHKNPEQVERLLHALTHPDFHFYIHVDKKTDQQPFEYLAKRPDTTFIKTRTKIYWAGYGTIQATLNGFEEMATVDYDYVNVISGQDFPIKSASYIHRYIAERNGSQFMTCDSIDDVWTDAAKRVRKYHFINWRIPGKFRLQFLVNRILPERKYPLDHKIVGRANWFAITKEAATYILDFLKQHPEIVRYYKYCWGADEFIFATTLYNSHFKEQLLENFVYVDWTGQTEGHPRLLTIEDLPRLQQSNKLFARKIDSQQNDNLISALEKHIQQ
ncbi:MAG: beta-1,6-N-acetylglucosaminyltransferase [Lacibacter sp.]